MDSKLLRTFVAVANHGSFTGAAKELYIAQSAVSKHINQLERELGAQLFLRDTRMVRLTAAGEGFYRDSVDILRRMDAARTALQREQGGEHGRLALGAFSVVPTEIVALARRFHACWSGWRAGIWTWPSPWPLSCWTAPTCAGAPWDGGVCMCCWAAKAPWPEQSSCT